MPVQHCQTTHALKDLMRATDRSHPSHVKMQVALRDIGKAIADCDDHLNVAKLLQIEELTQGKHSSRHRLSSNEEDDDSGEDEGRRGRVEKRLIHDGKIESTDDHRTESSLLSGGLKMVCAYTLSALYVFSDCLMYARLGDPIQRSAILIVLA